jgi:hypothetical protein
MAVIRLCKLKSFVTNNEHSVCLKTTETAAFDENEVPSGLVAKSVWHRY